MRPQLLIFLILLIFTSCSKDNYVFLAKGNLEDNLSYEVKNVFSCCGCKASFFNIYKSKRIVEQVVYSYNCYKPGPPTKYLFTYDKTGKVTDCEAFIFVTDSSYLNGITKSESIIFTKLDSTLGNFKGSRKIKPNEVMHAFPFVKGGYKLAVK